MIANEDVPSLHSEKRKELVIFGLKDGRNVLVPLGIGQKKNCQFFTTVMLRYILIFFFSMLLVKKAASQGTQGLDQKESVKPQKVKKVEEFFFHSADLFSHPYCIAYDTIKKIDYQLMRNRIIVKTKNRKIVFRADSVWGMRTLFPSGGYSYLCRYYSKWNMFLNVSQIDQMVIYHSSGGRLGTLLFSRTPDSDIFDLNKENLLEVFKDNPKFIELLKQNKDWGSYKEIDGHKKYKIIELYKKSLN